MLRTRLVPVKADTEADIRMEATKRSYRQFADKIYKSGRMEPLKMPLTQDVRSDLTGATTTKYGKTEAFGYWRVLS